MSLSTNEYRKENEKDKYKDNIVESERDKKIRRIKREVIENRIERKRLEERKERKRTTNERERKEKESKGVVRMKRKR